MANINLSWIVKLVVLMVGIGVVLGVSVYHNIDAQAPSTSIPNAAATPSAGASQPGSAARPSIITPHIDPATLDHMLDPFREVLKVGQQFAELQNSIAEHQNQRKAEQIETEGREKALALQRSIDQQKAEQDLAMQRTIAQVAIGAVVVLVVALAASIIVFALLVGWSRTNVARARAAQITAQTEAVSAVVKTSDQQEQWKNIWRAVGDLARQQTHLRNEFDSMRGAAASAIPAMPSQHKFTDLLLAVMKDD